MGPVYLLPVPLCPIVQVSYVICREGIYYPMRTNTSLPTSLRSMCIMNVLSNSCLLGVWVPDFVT